jgi:hypothetical protein
MRLPIFEKGEYTPLGVHLLEWPHSKYAPYLIT